MRPEHPFGYNVAPNMRTLGTQVKLRRLIRSWAEISARLESQPPERRLVGALVDRLEELAADVRAAWVRESSADRLLNGLEPALAEYVTGSLRTAELAIAGLRQAGADVELLRGDFEAAALPLEVFLRGLDAEPALQRSA